MRAYERYKVCIADLFDFLDVLSPIIQKVSIRIWLLNFTENGMTPGKMRQCFTPNLISESLSIRCNQNNYSRPLLNGA